MGMFDWVEFEMPCPKCGERVGGFQTKSGKGELGVVLPYRVGGDMYADCRACKTWIEFEDGYMVSPIDEGNDLPMPPFGG